MVVGCLRVVLHIPSSTSLKEKRMVVRSLKERIAVLERIATDPAERTAREIDALRDR